MLRLEENMLNQEKNSVDYDVGGATVDVLQVQESIKLISEFEPFKGSDRLTNLLKYIVIEELNGRGTRLKAYSIATQVLGRGENFDSQLDSIVRVEMGRLRTALKLYYAENKNVSLNIEIPKGGYRPVISILSRPKMPTISAVLERIRASLSPRFEGIKDVINKFSIFAVATFIALSLAFYFNTTSKPIENLYRQSPVLFISPVVISSPNPANQVFELGLTSELLNEMSRYASATVVYGNDLILTEDKNINRSLYRVTIRIVINGQFFSTVTTLQDAHSGRIRWTRNTDGELTSETTFTTLTTTVKSIGAEISMASGAITRAELQDLRPQDRGSYSCQLIFREYSMEPTQLNRSKFLMCAAYPSLPKDSLGSALSANAMLDRAIYDRGSGRSTMLAEAQKEIEIALAGRSKSPFIYATAAKVFACKDDRLRTEFYFSEATQNFPNSPNGNARLAFIRAFSLGEIRTSSVVRKDIEHIPSSAQFHYNLVAALDHIIWDNPNKAIEILDGAAFNTSHLSIVLRAAAYGETENREAMISLFRTLPVGLISSFEDIEAYVANECLHISVRNKLSAALKKASVLLLRGADKG